MPLPSYARVTNVRNGHSVIVRVNDRGPFHSGRVLDVSQKVAEVLAFRSAGTGQVKVDYIGPASLAGSDDALLLASLRTDGKPATLPAAPPSGAPATMVADAAGQASPAQSASQAQSSGVVTVEQSPRAAAPTGPQGAMGATMGAGMTLSQTPPLAGTRASPVLSPVLSPPAPLAMNGSVAPPPPRRPLDLSTIPGADTPIMAPPPRPRPSASFFAAPSEVTSFFIERGPFDGVDTTGVQSLR